MDTALAKLADEAADCNNERFTCMIELKVGLLLVAGFEIIFFSMGINDERIKNIQPKYKYNLVGIR